MHESEPRAALVVDDDRDVVNLVRFRFERNAWRALVAADGVSALEIAHEQHPDMRARRNDAEVELRSYQGPWVRMLASRIALT